MQKDRRIAFAGQSIRKITRLQMVSPLALLNSRNRSFKKENGSFVLVILDDG